jgi:hypothetical protein
MASLRITVSSSQGDLRRKLSSRATPPRPDPLASRRKKVLKASKPSVPQGSDDFRREASSILPSTSSSSSSPSSSAPSPVSPQQQPRQHQSAGEHDTAALKTRLLRTVASLDRGIAATRQQQATVDSLTRQLENAWARQDLQANSAPLAGRWRLVYTSGFSSGSLGGSRPGPPTFLLPFTLGQVYQRIQVGKENLNNIVELLFPAPFSLPFGPPAEPLIVQINLGHSFEMTGPQTTRIAFDKTTVRTRGPAPFRNLRPLQTPEVPEPFRPPKDLRSASFDTTYLDGDFRVSRGDRGELRVYVREE